ncbi:RNA polymerase-associated protein RapA [Nitrosomonas sp. Is24]|uniref:RNA polymerase-associated protein RapA n=1 Tax=Nitrosomonas sp. Is24 TaxID=3080533 RepID=UPI00294A9F6A|nr:RNA polymerase-associated protein RapA [Nitrosomonas sp. Is24]MDV6340199.1 RNA polymerase-associated protein RapA [Nitrosomonas sp. Is24]
MQDFKPGQRWICDVDLQLGLGTVQTVEHRIVTILFKATGETRSYAKQSAPLTRVIFKPGDTVSGQDGAIIKVTGMIERDGLIVYTGTHADGSQVELAEDRLAPQVQLNRPSERLFTGQFDQDKWFRIRYQTLLIRNRLANAPLYGLVGTRTSLIPHQLYIAREVGRRFAPRVLLADEVGLGKTIEAGLILHQQLLTERAKRVLIVVPETLIHQWLVEMLRRFNLQFSIFDEERCLSLEASDEDDEDEEDGNGKESENAENPFHSEQLVLCSLHFLRQNPQRFQQALEGRWDLLVVDEAHHLHWSPQAASPQYAMIEQLAARTPGVLLLTATPEQLGKASHYARLRLLDPHRFSSFSGFVTEEQSYEPIARAVEALLEGKDLSGDSRQLIADTLDPAQAQALLAELQDQQARNKLAESLLDRHGTGRILFRNTRAAVKGFPERKLVASPLPLPAEYLPFLVTFETTPLSKPQLLLCPELIYQVRCEDDQPYWSEIDPRVNWLIATLKRVKPEKVLVIAANAQTARDLAQALKETTGQFIPVFHESMSLIERDRAAAFFADKETGGQVLICSEIGSEGRNFQFAHHLVLFDLPLNPDLLEQRIGRLDRIGQTDTIQIHVPYLENSALAVMFHWYHEGLNAFEKTCPAGQTVFVKVEEQLIAALHQRQTQAEALAGLIGITQTAHRELNEALDCGRDKLLEYNSFRPIAAEQLTQAARTQDNDPALPQYMETVFDCCGVHIEDHRSGSFLIEPSEHMSMPFPGLQDEGSVITYAREVALANEDMHFLTWEHPMVTHAMERILSHENGNAVVAMLKHKRVQPGTLLLETLFVLEASGHNVQQSNRYLPPAVIRIVLDEHGSGDYPFLDHDSVNQHLQPVATGIAKQVIQLKEDAIRELLTASEQQASAQAPQLIAAAEARIQQTFTPEIERLKALQQVNPNVREEEIQFFEQQLQQLTTALKSSNLRLDAVRVIVAT